ncbi:GNAT family N-acetyltransferase [Amycolatopsis sp. FDAARGOS 1241]|uniref:GNAT family N-acetyltransferase n=1 Tax=Amycolatopsis sp. FDAARGOS 1241 TaxID=2778070 RepID=UPI00351C3E6C
MSCWREANVARGKAPGSARVGRVREKLADPAAVVLVAVSGGVVVGMVVAEEGRAGDGGGPVEPGLCHVSMVFVRPEWWGRGVGTAVLGALRERAAGLGYGRLQLWTGAANQRALGLYRRVGFRASGRSREIPGVGAVVHLEFPLSDTTHASLDHQTLPIASFAPCNTPSSTESTDSTKPAEATRPPNSRRWSG